MDSADSAIKAALLTLTSAQVIAAVLAALLAGMIALAVSRVLRMRRMRAAEAALPLPAHWLDHTLEGAVILAPIVAALATLLAAHLLISVLGIPTSVIMGAVRIVGALLLLRLVVFVLGLLLGPGSWVRTRGIRITLILWAIAAMAMLGWLDVIEARLNGISLVPGRTQFSLWALLKGLVVVTAFVVVASLIGRGLERHVMRLDGVAVSSGAACSSGKVQPSHVLAAMGVAQTLAQGAIRVSLGPTTTESEVDRFLDAWIRLSKALLKDRHGIAA